MIDIAANLRRWYRAGPHPPTDDSRFVILVCPICKNYGSDTIRCLLRHVWFHKFTEWLNGLFLGPWDE